MVPWRGQGLFLVLLIFLPKCFFGRGRAEVRGDTGLLPDDRRGLFPNILNLAASASVTVNATCGMTGPEIYCKLVEHNDLREPQCGVCDKNDPSKAHPITNVIDGSNRWWQSPTLANGKHFEWVTITLDLHQPYQVAYVIVKSAISPRPGNWILERSLNGIDYVPWQYFAISDTECWERYNVRPTIGKPRFRTDDEVICTSYYSSLNPLENGEIHTSLVNGRPGADGPSDKLKEFTKARYVRLRLQKIRTLNADLMTMERGDHIDKSVTRRYFYTIKDISIGGQCICNGHASECRAENSTIQRCKCKHNTCGEHCDRCCDLYNQKPWKPGTNLEGAQCEMCQCFGHADKCYYEQSVADKKQSLNIHGEYEGGGVCSGCKHHTAGVNCEKCADRYYRPAGVRPDDPRPCRECNCSGPGMSGLCVKDEFQDGMVAGQCHCRKGFRGPKCDQCDIGYRNFPRCEPCYCNPAGTTDPYTCNGPCSCKANVIGERCDQCKPAHYDLASNNPLGCSSCFCFGITNRCEEGDWGVVKVQTMLMWKVANLEGTRRVTPFAYDGNLHIADDDMSIREVYYWEAPKEYIGKKLYSYGGELHFKISYIIDRGDTSGTYIDATDMVIEGDGLRLGYKWDERPEGEDGHPTNISLPMREHGWFVMLEGGGRAEAKRAMFARAMNSLSRLLIRAKFHTDQIEGVLYDVGMEEASKESGSRRKMTGVEKCFCPPGYSGLSCEECTPDYRRINTSLGEFVCEPCDCNHHAESCDSDGRCINCLHNTTGAKCDRCLPGFYGDARRGMPDDCKRCACPLEEESNNFSPTCIAVTTPSGEQSYTCTACPAGYGGTKCEICVEGYFGSPTLIGGFCQPCDCSGNANTSLANYCDRTTGRCLHCIGNTGGWNCNECLPGHYGSALEHNCRICDCNSFGSESPECNRETGQCFCKPNYVGRTCSRCRDGYGNVEAGCVPCWCNRVGSRTEVCDPVTGQCHCKPGVFGNRCDSCLEGHYGFSEEGCRLCACHPYGSESPRCDEASGQCQCKPHVVRRTCDHCEPGYWNLESGNGCIPCTCNATGSLSSVCDETTGQCQCKPGIGGLHCDHCLPGWFGLTPRGCRKCDPCDAPGHICDPNTGRCVCPPHTTGDRCQYCQPTAWGYHPTEGCKSCNCNPRGSRDQQCDDVTGMCHCLEGFEGRHCDQCRIGFYQFPNCQRCECDPQGTNLTLCPDPSHCQCDERGQCPCKVNVVGKRCDQCKEGAFGLSADNPRGCFECFCFGRTHDCEQANLAWSHEVTMFSREVTMDVGNDEISTVYGYRVIPGYTGAVRMGIPYVLDQPLYWNLPKEFLGDKVSAYNGRLHFRIESSGGTDTFPDTLMRRFPLVVLQGNHRIILTHHPQEKEEISHLPNRFMVRIHEDDWRNAENPYFPVTRDMLMVALQNLQHVLIRGTTGPEVKHAKLYDVSLELAVSTPRYTPTLASGVETCRCPPQYVGLSCQDPAPGYYRKRKPDYLDSKDILDLVGWAEPCDCNNRSRTCDRETGICYNCTDNSTGLHCELCAKGFYEDALRKRCLPCSCPLPNNRFSETCRPDGLDYICIDCEQGYTGRHCEKCSDGYFGDPTIPGGSCQPCDCDPYGSKSRICDKVTGQCSCILGTVGRACAQCHPRHILTEYGCKTCEDACTGLLFQDLDNLNRQLGGVDLGNMSAVPWSFLRHLDNEADQLRMPVDDYNKRMDRARQLASNVSLLFDLETQADVLYKRAIDIVGKSPRVANDAFNTLEEARELLEAIRQLREQLRDLVEELAHYGLDPDHLQHLATDRILAEAERILQELRRRNFVPRRDEAERELRAAEDLIDRIRKLTRDKEKLQKISDRLDKLESLLEEFVTLVDEKVRTPLDEARGRIGNGRHILDAIQAIIKEIVTQEQATNNTLREAEEILREARNFVIDATIKFELLPRLLRQLENGTLSLEQVRGILDRLNPEYLALYVEPAQRHADALHEQAAQLARLFNATREVSQHPLRAAQIYQNIIDAINEAEEAAKLASLAADQAYLKAYPGTVDALTEQARKAKIRSQELLEEANRLSHPDIPVLLSNLAARKREITSVAESLATGRINIDIINRELNQLPKGLGDALRESEARAQAAVSRCNAAHQRIDTVQDDIRTKLQPQLEALQTGTIAGMENLTRIIEQARSDIRESSRRADRAEIAANNLNKAHQKFQLDLKALKDRILLARQMAASIRVSITPDGVDPCARSYRSPLEPSTTNNLVLNYAIEGADPDSLLLFVGSAKSNDFMAIEMVDRKIRFLWSAGGEVHTLSHPRHIASNNKQLFKNDRWYKIEVNRFGSVATLSVKKTPKGQDSDPMEVSGSASPEFSRMDLDFESHVYVGGFPKGYKIPSAIHSRHFVGCLYEVILDGKHVGLWNFLTSTPGCTGCTEGASEWTDISAYQFRGEGYAIIPQIRRYNKNYYMVALWFKSLDEDALLFLSPNPDNGDFVAIQLRGGHVVYELNLGGTSRLVLRTVKKYNTGKWVQVAGARERQQGQLLVDEELLEGHLPPGGPTSLDINKSQLYYGGVPPNFSTEAWATVTFQKFYGCMRDVQIDTTPVDLLQHSSYDIDPGCKDRGIQSAMFKGKGYLELQGQPLGYESSFGLTFLTQQSEALLLLSTFEGRRAPEDKRKHFYSVTVSGGKLDVRCSTGNGVSISTTNSAVNDGRYHTLTVVKSSRILQVFVDDVEVATTRMPWTAREIVAPADGGLYLGGVKQGMNVGHMVPNQAPFIGTIKDCIFNKKLVYFNSPVNFAGVLIGREDPEQILARKLEIEQMPDVLEQQLLSHPEVEICRPPPTYHIERRALNFGSSLTSHLRLPVPKGQLSSDFNVTLRLRRGSRESGLILAIASGKRQQYLAMSVQARGDLHVDLRGKRESGLLRSEPLTYNTWHTVSIVKSGRLVRLIVDGTQAGKSAVLRRKYPLRSPVFLGGIPKSHSLSKKLAIRESFQGCISEVQLNGKQFSLDSGQKHALQPCLASIEPGGTYLDGSGFATSGDNYSLEEGLEIELELRTSHISGLVLALPGAGGNAFDLTLELRDGQVVLQVVGSGLTLRAVQEHPSRHTLCDGRWHVISLSYRQGSLLLSLDALKPVSDESKVTARGPAGPLYIGGLPDDVMVQHLGITPPMRFMGCLRNVRINKTPFRWNRAKLFNIFPNACPTF